ncbi:hypothetical protein NAP1_13868 [Erythrobacter sp. NAP1]|uniref:hypothetical protein n=1 Tax=Erythrobacter sp. NAP1 TaxID=237727 RepID=UPI00006878D2|nr:hypothetical protein [Erythrobacter sp. NAP1]EAQ28691.1 hypothetical protein NAP1_13868 [Erythrobacter sp. NAP1]
MTSESDIERRIKAIEEYLFGGGGRKPKRLRPVDEELDDILDILEDARRELEKALDTDDSFASAQVRKAWGNLEMATAMLRRFTLNYRGEQGGPVREE